MEIQERKSALDRFKDFDLALKDARLFPLQADSLDTMQINLGRRCNLSCSHCHVEAGPDRTEAMSRETMQHCLDIIRRHAIATVDLTGGAPEMTPGFEWLVTQCRDAGARVMVRTNLTIMLEDGYTDLPEFFRDQQVELIASLPCYTKDNVDRQRGKRVYERSIRVLKMLNECGYGQPDSDCLLHLVYNPGGPSLPGDQQALEQDYKRELAERFDIRFNNLYTITNMPIGRFEEFLTYNGQYEKYMQLLVEAFNPQAAGNVMCRNLISVGWDGSLFDCDFNQMLGLRCDHGAPTHIKDFDYEHARRRKVVTGMHCYGCTAGAGSSCSGALDAGN